MRILPMVGEHRMLPAMPKTSRYLFSGLLVWVWLASGMGCASTAPPARIIYEDPNRLVRLEVIYRSEGKDHDHPVKINRNEISEILREPTVSPKPVQPLRGPFEYEKGHESEEPSQLFSEENLNFLSEHLAQALQRATPAEDVMFFINHSEKPETSEITSGSVFVNGKQFHLLFGNYRHRTVGTSEIQKARATPLEVLGSPMYDLSPGPFGKIQESGGLKVFVTGAPQHLIIDYVSFLKTRGLPDEQNTASPKEVMTPTHSLANKLQELKELREKELITEKEYLSLRSKLLKKY